MSTSIGRSSGIGRGADRCYNPKVGSPLTELDMPSPGIKKQAQKLVDSLPENATWEDLQYRIFVRQKIERGIKSLEEEETLSTEQVLEHFGLGEK